MKKNINTNAKPATTAQTLANEMANSTPVTDPKRWVLPKLFPQPAVVPTK